MTPTLPAWSLAAALLRLSVTLGVLAVLGVSFFLSLKRVNLDQLEAQTSRVEQPLGTAERLSLTLAPDLSRTLTLSGSDSPSLSAELSASREGDLRLSPAPLPSTSYNREESPSKGEVSLILKRSWRDLPPFIELGRQNGLPGHLKVKVPRTVPLRLNVQQPADQTTLDLHDLNVKRLVFSSSSGQWNVTLPKSGQPDLSFKTTDGDLMLQLPEGEAQTTLSATSTGGQLVLSVPLTARVKLTIKQLGGDVQLPPSFQQLDTTTDESERDPAQTRQYLQAGHPDGPQLTATLSLTGGSLTVKGVSP